ncbi:sugar kinase [Aquimarina sp. AD10]|uniref:sugar kinase n=1 Tax=Aquimarina sp. AD10 TaxID=1714849 RepID=UPI000E50913F|nr:sugar kinase [Aquimarina sp. AD10]AXT63205.1 sugar kinase [Aquimarina sp. AD10]RKN00784.1 sugar kinase [Aquimarina sp. AD10]
MKKIITFGEILMRISPIGNKKMIQSNTLEYYFGGTEVNVAISLAQLGNDVKHVSVVSEDFIGHTAKSFLNQYGVDTSLVTNSGYPLGLYFLETGAVMRPSTISYNRSNSSFSMMDPNLINWNAALDVCDWFHWTGITPALSKQAYQSLKVALQTAKNKNIMVSADPTYRKDLWKYGAKPQEVLNELIELSDIFIGGPNEINELLNTNFKNNTTGFIEGSKHLLHTFPNLKKIFDKTRISTNANWHKIKSRMWDGANFFETEQLEITHIIDRIGTGDAYAAGLIHGLLHFNDKKALKFANAACALKHTIEGDANLVLEKEIELVMNGSLTGRINR